jgi:hypothetical protein
LYYYYCELYTRYKIFLWKRRILNKKPVSGMHINTVVKVDEKKEEKKEEESLF